MGRSPHPRQSGFNRPAGKPPRRIRAYHILLRLIVLQVTAIACILVWSRSRTLLEAPHRPVPNQPQATRQPPRLPKEAVTAATVPRPTTGQNRVPTAPTGHLGAKEEDTPRTRKLMAATPGYSPVRSRSSHRPAGASQRGGAATRHAPRGDHRTRYALLARVLVERTQGTLPGHRKSSCIVVCVIRRDGSLKHAELVKRSGAPSADAATLRAVRLTNFPPVPREWHGEEFSFALPLSSGGSRR